MDRCRKRDDSEPEGPGEPEPPADKRPCTAEPSTSAAAAAPPLPAGARPAEQGGSDMDTSSSGHAGDADADADDGDGDGDGDGEGDGDGGSSCESDGDGSPRPRGVRAGRFNQMVEAVAAEGAGPDALVAALTELCEALSFCAEDAGGYFPTDAAARALVRRAGGGDGAEASPDVILLSMRAITYLCDAMPRAADAVVRHGLLPLLCSRLLAIEYLDVAEQCLQAFEKISRRQPAQCLQAGMITAVLTYIDFFTASIQRVAVSAVANACRKVPADCSNFVVDSVPTLCNLLQSEDKMVVEKVAACLISIVDSFSSSVDLLDQLCHQGIIEKVLPLIHTGGLTALSPSTCSNLIGLLAKLACSSLVAVKSLFELNVGSTIKGILVTSDLSHGMPYLPLEKQNNQGLMACEIQNPAVEPCQKEGTSSSGPAERNTIVVNDHALQPKLVFSLKGKELDRSVTLYQSVLQDQINAGSDIILDMQFWRSVHDITFRTAAKPEANRTSINLEADSPKETTTVSSKDDSTNGFKWQMLPFFSSMLLGKLPCKLDRSNPLYDILFMLHILEGLNRYSFHLISDERNNSFAHGMITNLDDLKAVVFSIPQQEFVSAKLTDKLEQQLHDPLVSRSSCLPLWCTELMSACPFLFSFEARWKYFQLSAFGSLKNHHGHIMDTVTERGHSHSRKKFKVDREDILVSAAKMMKSYAKSNALLEVEYNEEVGTGLGPTMEFYTLISHEFQKSGLGMWRGELPCEAGTDDAHVSRFVVAPKGLFPRPWSASADCASFQEVSKQFHLLGQVVAKAIKDGRILDIPFSKAFYKLILGQELNIYDIQSFDSELAISLMEFQAIACRRKYAESKLTRDCHIVSDLTYRGCRIEDLAIDFALPGYPDYRLSSGSRSDSLNVDNLEEYVHHVVEETVKSGITRQMEAFKSGFNEVFPLSKLQVFSEDELERLLCGEQDTWDFGKLVDHIKFDHGYTSSSPPVINLLEIIQEFGSHQRRAFLQFITGSPRLPPGGLAALNPKFTVVRKHNSNDADNDLPSVMTCANYLKLPPYSSKEKMREKLIYAITEGQGSFHLS
ncbi:unnamed protein product [Urochloa decumbens]|uniref:HECT-type E3 ubiquitin transferase n=1 Tax=Urochloa decumbens TaxID=240449 RepID=A0ABC8VNL2_9POAL